MMEKQIRHRFDERQLVEVISAISDLTHAGISPATIQQIKDDLKLN